MSITNFPPALVPLIQQNFLARFIEEGLDSELAYRREAIVETIPGRIGQTVTMTRYGRKPPVPTPMNPQTLTAFDNGMTPSTCAVEQYSYTLAQYGDTVDVDLMGEIVGIANQLRMNSRNSGVQGAQTLERIAKNRLFAAYNTGNSFVNTNLGAGSTTTCYVDDIRGFQLVMVNGQLVPVSASNPLTVQESPSSAGGLTQTLTVTSVVATANNGSVFPSDNPGVSGSAGVSGILTFGAVTTPVNGDALIALNAPQVVRPNGKQATTQLQLGDVFSFSVVQDAVQILRSNGVPTFPDGTYHLILDNVSNRQLFADQQFQIMAASRINNPEFQAGRIFSLFDVTFITTTEAYVQAPASSAGVNVTVRRPILMGAESLLQGNFEGLELWLNREGFEPIGNIVLVDGVAQILRPPLDRLQRMASLSWTAILDFAVPTDMTANSSIIPTASNALYKRCVAIEHAG